MAEVFGIVAGAVSIAAVFNNCVDCFEYVHIARQFNQDFSAYLLRLDIAKCRLERWGAGININQDPRFTHNEPVDPTIELAQKILKQIVDSFDMAQMISRHYEIQPDNQSREICTEEDLDSVSRRLHDRFRRLTLQRQNRVGLIKKTSWALYDKNRMEKMIGDIARSIQDLEQVFPATSQATNSLVQMEVEEVNDEEELKMIEDAAQGLDPVLESQAKEKLEELTGKNSARRITGPGRVNIGNVYVNESFKGFRENSINYVDEIITEEPSRVNIGNTYGGKGIWD